MFSLVIKYEFINLITHLFTTNMMKKIAEKMSRIFIFL